MRQDHKRLLPAVVGAEIVLSASITVPGNLCASQPRLAGDHFGVLALLADDGNMSGLVLQSHSCISLAAFCCTRHSTRRPMQNTIAVSAIT